MRAPKDRAALQAHLMPLRIYRLRKQQCHPPITGRAGLCWLHYQAPARLSTVPSRNCECRLRCPSAVPCVSLPSRREKQVAVMMFYRRKISLYCKAISSISSLRIRSPMSQDFENNCNPKFNDPNLPQDHRRDHHKSGTFDLYLLQYTLVISHS